MFPSHDLDIGSANSAGGYADDGGAYRESDGQVATYTKSKATNTTNLYVQGTADGNYPNIRADLEDIDDPATIQDLREAFALYRYQEARARYGGRYVEYLRYLGIRSSDARLQRPEYLGGGRQTIQFSEVLQTGVTTDGDDTEGVGNLKGHGIGALRSNRYRRFFEEHGYIFTLLSVKPKTIYNNGIARHFMYQTKEDFFQRELQHIGQQEVYTGELDIIGNNQMREVFGWQDRYDHLRRSESTIAAQFRSTLNFWHYARIFGSQPTLNADFVKCTPTKRVNAVTSEDVLWVMANHSIQARRQVSAVSTSFVR